MEPHFKRIVHSVEPLEDSIYGLRFRCALTLKDGTCLPSAIIQSKKKLVDLAKRRIKEEMKGKGVFSRDRYGQIVASFVTGSNRVSDYDVKDAEPSRFAPPVSLLRQIHGETTMGWTGWVLEMTDGCLFAYGSSFTMDFFDLPEGYGFGDVAHVHNHSFLSKEGELRTLERGGFLPGDYAGDSLFRERVYFTCAVDGI